eukprot:7033158-Karenia_brevis.AAC.1
MVALKLITSLDKPHLLISSSSAATRCHCPPFSQAEMAALKQITSSDRACYASHQAMRSQTATAHPSRTLKWLR